MLVNILIIFFLFLIIYQFLAPSLREGLETTPGPYMEYPNDPMILGKQNAGNIEVLRTEVQKVSTLEPRVLQLETDVKNLNEQLAGIQQQNSEAVSSFGSSVGGLTGETEEGEDSEVVPGEGKTEGESSSSSFGGFGGSSGEGEEGEGEGEESSSSSWGGFGGSSGEGEEGEGEGGESSSSSWGGFGGSSEEEKESFRNKYVLKHYF